MTPERWQQIEQLYHEALAREAPERAAFLDDACGGNEALRREVESLLTQERSADDFLARPAVEMAGKDAESILTPRTLGVECRPRRG